MNVNIDIQAAQRGELIVNTTKVEGHQSTRLLIGTHTDSSARVKKAYPFFVVGKNAETYPELIDRIIDDGHEIGNHTYSHPCVNKQSQAAFREELTRCEEIIQRVVGVHPKLFRPPQGSWNTRVYEIARERDYSVILWDLDTLDWAHTPSENISNYILENVKSGNIILMHDFIGHNSKTPEALEKIIPVLISRGYEFVTVSELLGVR